MARALGIAVGTTGLMSACERGSAVAFTPYRAACVGGDAQPELVDPHALADAVVGVLAERLSGEPAEVVLAHPVTWPVEAVHDVAAALAQRQIAHWLITDAAAVYRALSASGRTPAKRTTVVCDCAATGTTVVSVVDSDSNGIRTLGATRIQHPERLSSRGSSTRPQPGASGAMTCLAPTVHGDEAARRIAEFVAQYRDLAIELVVLTGSGKQAADLRRTLSEVIGLPVVVDPAPEHSPARGAALVASAVVAALTPTAADHALSHPDRPLHLAGPPTTALPAITIARPDTPPRRR